MNKLENIIQYHIDNNLDSVESRYKKELNKADLQKLKSAIELNSRLKGIRVFSAFGKQAFESALREIGSNEELIPKTRFGFLHSGVMKAGVALSALALIISGFGIGVFRNKSNTNAPISKISNISANGTVDSVNSINLADAESEQVQLQSEVKSIETVKSDLGATTNISEAINENI